MAQTLVKRPQVYRPGLWTRLRAGLRYGGGSDQWSWLAHRVTGIGIALFLLIHIVDTFIVVAYPRLYDHTVGIYGGVFDGTYYWPLRWAFRVGELGLIACVVFHAINGVRLIAFDFWPRASEHRKALSTAVLVAFLAIMVPVTIWVLIPLASTPNHWKMPASDAGPALVSAPHDAPR
ncbi:MAG: succinate dehydrogenase [Isosphaeraceae bacterium]